MSFENSAGLGVNNSYGIRGTQDGIVGGGKLPVSGSIDEMVVYITAADFGADETFDTRFTLPAGSVPLDALFEVTEAFTQTGGTTSLTLNVGTNGSEATNGFTITDAATSIAVVTELDAVGDGTWANLALAADTAVGVSLVAGGGTITSVDGGAAKVVIRYRKV
jgi:hypothetical protein